MKKQRINVAEYMSRGNIVVFGENMQAFLDGEKIPIDAAVSQVNSVTLKHNVKQERVDLFGLACLAVGIFVGVIAVYKK